MDELARIRERREVMRMALATIEEEDLRAASTDVSDDDVERTSADCASVLGYDATAVPDVAAALADRDLDEAFLAAMLQRLTDLTPWCYSPADLPRWLVAALDDSPLAVVERMARRSHLRGV